MFFFAFKREISYNKFIFKIFYKKLQKMLNLKDVKLLESLTETEINFLESVSQKRSLKAWEILFNMWEEASALYILLEWKLEAYVSDDNILWEIYAEDIVGEMWLLSERKTRMSSVRAKQDSILIVILPFAIDSLKKDHPEIIEKITGIIKDRKEMNKWKI